MCVLGGDGNPHIPPCLGLCPYTPGQKPELAVCPLDSRSLPRRAIGVERASEVRGAFPGARRTGWGWGVPGKHHMHTSGLMLLSRAV